jgi:hypothetical protein
MNYDQKSMRLNGYDLTSEKTRNPWSSGIQRAAPYEPALRRVMHYFRVRGHEHMKVDICGVDLSSK